MANCTGIAEAISGVEEVLVSFIALSTFCQGGTSQTVGQSACIALGVTAVEEVTCTLVALATLQQ